MKRFLFSAAILTAMLASCTDENFETANNGQAVQGRTQINLTLQNDGATTRIDMAGETGMKFDANDKLGAVLVDNGVINKVPTVEEGEPQPEQNYVVDWRISDSHAGNNKWNNTGDYSFTTEGTTSIGAWLFYSRYNEDMSVNRNGVEYTFPQIQEYAPNYQWIANNNVNFIVSPIYRINGYEGQEIQIPVINQSIHTSVKLNLQLPSTVKEVQKIVLTAKDATGMPVEFPTKGRILNTKMEAAGAVANLLTDKKNASYDPTYGLLRHVYNSEYEDMVIAANKAAAAFRNDDVDLATITDTELGTKYVAISEAVGDNKKDFLVLDCVNNHSDEAAPGVAVTGGKFTSYMLIPAGIYQSITLYVYTNGGIYVKEVAERDAALEKTDANKLKDGSKNILLRRHTRVNLANITKKASEVEDAAIKIEYKKTAEEVAQALGGVVVTKTADLIAAIQGAQQKVVDFQVVNQAAQNFGSDEAVPEHSTRINKAVADAVLAKWSDARTGNVKLNFLNAKMEIVGDETPYDLVAMTFQKGSKLTTGSVNVAEQVFFGNDSFDVMSGATANFTKGAKNNLVAYNIDGQSSTITNEGTVNFTGYAKMGVLVNKNGGVVNVDQTLNVLDNMKNYEAINVNEKGELTVSNLTNVGSEGNVTYNATVVNNNLLTFTGAGTNGGVITNNKKVEVEGTLNNKFDGSINNAKGATFIAQVGGKVTNEMGASMTNSGELYCIIEGSKRGQIMNYGTITAEEGALTYITTNQEAIIQSTADLKKDNIDDTNIGRIILKERGSNMSVSTANMQGIIEYTLPENTSKWTPQDGDKFNKLILANSTSSISNPVDLTALNHNTDGITKVISVELSGNSYVKFANNQALKELIIKGNVNVLGQEVSTAILRVMNGKLTIPTNNVFGVYAFTTDETGNAVSDPIINNHATILVGGRFYTSLPQTITSNNGEFASGAGSEAYIFESTNWQ